MTILEVLNAHPDVKRMAAETIAEFETTGASGHWKLEFHHEPGGALKSIKFVDRVFEFRFKDPLISKP